MRDVNFLLNLHYKNYSDQRLETDNYASSKIEFKNFFPDCEDAFANYKYDRDVCEPGKVRGESFEGMEKAGRHDTWKSVARR